MTNSHKLPAFPEIKKYSRQVLLDINHHCFNISLAAANPPVLIIIIFAEFLVILCLNEH